MLGRSSRPAVGPTHLSVQWVPGHLTLRVKWPMHEPDHSPHLILRLRINGTPSPLLHVPSWLACISTNLPARFVALVTIATTVFRNGALHDWVNTYGRLRHKD
jgi:hypothetical protein